MFCTDSLVFPKNIGILNDKSKNYSSNSNPSCSNMIHSYVTGGHKSCQTFEDNYSNEAVADKNYIWFIYNQATGQVGYSVEQ